MNDNFAGKFQEEYDKLKNEIKKVSILVLGGSGTGKSSLVNNVFKRDIASTGAGRPVTRGINSYENNALHIYDSEGYESGNQEGYNKLIEDFLKEKDKNPETAVHLAWYCVSAPSARFIELDAALIKKASRELSLAVVLTKIDIATKDQIQALTEAVNKHCSGTSLFMSTTEEISLENGLDALQQWSFANLDEARRNSFIRASNRNLAAKAKEGDKIVLQHITVAFGTGFVPIPFSDAPTLLANQGGMIARICFLWNLESFKEVLCASSGLGGVMSMLGKTVAGNLIKFIPVLGTIVGGIINGAVASALTYALGTALNKLCRKITEDQLAGKSQPFENYLTPEFFSGISTFFEQYRNSVPAKENA